MSRNKKKLNYDIACSIIDNVLDSLKQPVPERMQFRNTDKILSRDASRRVFFPFIRTDVKTETSDSGDFRCIRRRDYYRAMLSDFITENDYKMLEEKLKEATWHAPVAFNGLHSYEDDFITLEISGYYGEYIKNPDFPSSISFDLTVGFSQTENNQYYYRKHLTETMEVFNPGPSDDCTIWYKDLIRNELSNTQKNFREFVYNMRTAMSALFWVDYYPCSTFLVARNLSCFSC